MHSTSGGTASSSFGIACADLRRSGGAFASPVTTSIIGWMTLTILIRQSRLTRIGCSCSTSENDSEQSSGIALVMSTMPLIVPPIGRLISTLLGFGIGMQIGFSASFDSESGSGMSMVCRDHGSDLGSDLLDGPSVDRDDARRFDIERAART